MSKKILGVVSTWIIAAIVVGILYWKRDVSPMKDFVSWALSVWPILATIGAVAVCISGWIIKHDSKHIESLSSSLLITPHAYAFGLSGMTGYPNEPLNAAWLLLEVSVNAIAKPIDTLDLIIDGQTIPVNHWPGTNVTEFNAYFNVTRWHWKGKYQVELMAYVGDKMSRSRRIDLDFNKEPSGRSHPI